MNNKVKMLIGATIGGAFGWFVGRVVVEYIHMKEDMIDYHDITEFVLDIKEQDWPKEFSESPMNKASKMHKVEKSKARKNYDKMFEGRPDILELAKHYEGIDSGLEQKEIGGLASELVVEDEFEGPVDVTTNQEESDISIITIEEYANAEDFDRVTLYYYQDDILTNDKDHPLDRPERFLGEEALLSFDDDDVVYVRNLTKKAMYEVIRMDQDYSAPSGRRSIPKKGKKGFDYNEKYEIDKE